MHIKIDLMDQAITTNFQSHLKLITPIDIFHFSFQTNRMSQNKSQPFGAPNKIVSRILDQMQLLKQQTLQQTQNSSKQHPPNVSYDKNLMFSIQNDHKEKVQQLKRYKQGKLMQSVLQNSQQNNKQSAGDKKQQNIKKQREDLNQFVYENQTHTFQISRAKVPNKIQKFIDIEVHPKQSDLHYYKITLKNNQIPDNIKKTGVVTANILFTKLQKVQSTFRLVDDSLKFSVRDKQQDMVQCTIQMNKIKLSQDLIHKHKCQLLQKENRILEKRLEQQRKNFQKQIQDLVSQLQNEKQFKNNLLKEIKILRLQKQNNIQGGNNSNFGTTSNTNKKTTHNTQNNSNLVNGGNTNLVSPPVVNVNYLDNDIQIIPNNNPKPSHNTNANKDNQFSDIVQINDDSDDDKVEEISCQDHDSYYQDQRNKRPSTGRAKKTNKVEQPKINFDYISNDPYSLVHAVTGQVIHAGDLLKFRPKQPLYQKEVDQTLDAYRLRGGKPPRATQSISYNERRSVWKQYGRKYRNKQFSQLISNQIGYTQTKRLTKTNLNLPTMGFLQLFFQLLEIDLSSNKIQHIEGLYNCKKLRKLQLNNNLLTKIQGLDDQRELRELFLRQNKIVKIEGIFHIKKLQSFSLQGNRIDEIPDNISDLQFLRTFYLNQNCIKALPKSMASMTQNLKALRLSDNPQLNANQSSNKYVIDQLRKFGCNVFTKTLFQ